MIQFGKPLLGHFENEYPDLRQIIETGKLWRNKHCEKKVINFILKNGYDCIEILDELGDMGGETRAFIVANPQLNVYVSGEANERELKNEFDDGNY